MEACLMNSAVCLLSPFKKTKKLEQLSQRPMAQGGPSRASSGTFAGGFYNKKLQEYLG